ncbi:skin secretory protein xP2-like [Strigops habroptila]|uniref:skin secretory protein xP2-like n=1 Tax=Strigops habroptila TaxID=2489341 RepID=UPI0011CF7BD5|nr:skin secretory protein xP2-like [Strigops habroptila]
MEGENDSQELSPTGRLLPHRKTQGSQKSKSEKTHRLRQRQFNSTKRAEPERLEAEAAPAEGCAVLRKPPAGHSSADAASLRLLPGGAPRRCSRGRSAPPGGSAAALPPYVPVPNMAPAPSAPARGCCPRSRSGCPRAPSPLSRERGPPLRGAAGGTGPVPGPEHTQAGVSSAGPPSAEPGPRPAPRPRERSVAGSSSRYFAPQRAARSGR